MASGTPVPPLVAALLKPEAVKLLETHISYLFLTGKHVYKVKKPVNFGFLDFTTLEKRRYFCQQEVELNRRLSSGVYLGVVEISQDGDRYSIAGPGRVVEYAVQMRQLPHQRLMKELLLRRKLTETMVRRVARKIARFHLRAQTSEHIASLGGYQAVCQNVRENFAQTASYVGRTITQETYDDLRAYSEAFLEVRKSLFEARAREGWVRDCHGDLHTAQIFLEDGIQVIDCIEFNERFRYSDVVADIAFLAMDLDYHQRGDLSRALIGEYQKVLKDSGLPMFLEFYEVYRAYVRGKVEGFRLEDPTASIEELDRVKYVAAAYFHLAQSYVEPLRSPALYVTAGLMGSGKTRVATELARRWGATVISSDVVRKELAAIPEKQHVYVPFGQGIYNEAFTLRTYREMLVRTAGLIRQRRSVILDATFGKVSLREEALSVAKELGVPVIFVECVAPEPILRERLQRRPGEKGVVSDGRWEVYHQQKATFEPLDEVPPQVHLVVDTSRPEAETAVSVMKGIYSLKLAQQEEPESA